MTLRRILGNLAKSLDSSAIGSYLSKGASETDFRAILYSEISGTPSVVGDSAVATAIVDSAYVQARQGSTTGLTNIDSAASLAILDSDYMQSRITAGGVGFKVYHFETTNGQTTFQDSDADGDVLGYTENGILVFKNGVLLLDNSDYTASDGTSVVLTSGTDSGELVSIAKWSLGGGGGAVWYGDRQIRFGGLATNSAYLNVIEYFSNSSANATDFGDLTETTQGAGAASDGSRAIRASGANSTSMDYITTSTTGNATDFGDITECLYFSGIGDGTYAVFGDGDTFYYVTVQTTGNASSFSGVASSNMGGHGGAGNGTIGIFTGYDDEAIYKVTLATQSGAASHGTLSAAATIPGLVSDATYTVAQHGGSSADNTMSYITTATGGTSTDFGDLQEGKWYMGASSDHTYGYFSGGGDGTNKIQQITIATTGNASDFGDLITAVRLHAGTSGAAS